MESLGEHTPRWEKVKEIFTLEMMQCAFESKTKVCEKNKMLLFTFF